MSVRHHGILFHGPFCDETAQSFELLKTLARGQPRVAHVVKTCNTRETHVIIHSGSD